MSQMGSPSGNAETAMRDVIGTAILLVPWAIFFYFGYKADGK